MAKPEYAIREVSLAEVIVLLVFLRLAEVLLLQACFQPEKF